MILTIPKWPSDSDINHYATTWFMYSDQNNTILVDSLVESSSSLIGWESRVLIPTGKVYYVKALRHLKDANGNVINNSKYIGPKPIINDKSNVNDYLAPKFGITEPYITNLAYMPGVGIDIDLTPYEGNVGYKSTSIIIHDENDNVIYTDMVTDNTGKLSIPSNVVNFSLYNYITVTIIYAGLHSIVSRPYTETFYLKDVFYKIDGNTFNLDPNTSNTLVLDSTNVVPVTITSAVVNNVKDEFVTLCTFNNDVLTIPAILEFNTTYLVEVNLTYNDNNNVPTNITDTIVITMRNNDEKEVIDSNFKYKYLIEELRSYSHNAPEDKIKTSIRYNTEEFFTGLLPAIGVSTNKMDLLIYDKEVDIFNTAKSSVNNFNTNHTIRLVARDRGFIQYTHSGKVYISLFTYDGYNDTITITNTVSTSIKDSDAILQKVIEVSGTTYVVGVNVGNSKELLVYTLDIYTGNLVLEHRKTLPLAMSDVTISKYKDTGILIVPIGNGVSDSYVYSISNKYLTNSLTIPGSFINKKHILVNLKNGNIFGIKVNDTVDVLEFYIIDIYNNVIEVKKLPYNNGGSITNILKIRNGSVTFIIDNGSKKYIYELV